MAESIFLAPDHCPERWRDQDDGYFLLDRLIFVPASLSCWSLFFVEPGACFRSEVLRVGSNTSTFATDDHAQSLCCVLPINWCAFGAHLDVSTSERPSTRGFTGVLRVSFLQHRGRRAALKRRYRSNFLLMIASLKSCDKTRSKNHLCIFLELTLFHTHTHTHRVRVWERERTRGSDSVCKMKNESEMT